MVFHWSLSDSKSPQVSWTLLSILAVLNNVVVWMVSTSPLTSKSSSLFSNPLVPVPNAPITIGITVICIFYSFFNSLARSRYLSFFSHSFSFILRSVGTAKWTILLVLFFFCWLLLSLVFWPRLGDPCICRSPNYHYYYYYYDYDYFILLRVLHISVCCLFLTGVWVAASLLKSPSLFSVFCPVLNNVVVWMVSTRLSTSKSSSSFRNHLVTVSNAPITIGITVICIFHSFFNSLARSRYLSFFSNSFSFILWSVRTAPWEFYTSAFIDGLSLESEWQQVSSSLQDSSLYSGRSQ